MMAPHEPVLEQVLAELLEPRAMRGWLASLGPEGTHRIGWFADVDHPVVVWLFVYLQDTGGVLCTMGALANRANWLPEGHFGASLDCTLDGSVPRPAFPFPMWLRGLRGWDRQDIPRSRETLIAYLDAWVLA